MKIRNILIVAAALLSQISVFAQASFEVNGILYTEDLSDPSKLAVYVDIKHAPQLAPMQSAYKGEITIPSTVEHDLDTYQVTGIGKFAFSNSDTETLIISEGVITIGFYGIFEPKLKKIVLPSTLESVDKTNFYYCPALEEIHMGKGFSDLNIFPPYANIKTVYCPWTTAPEKPDWLSNKTNTKRKEVLELSDELTIYVPVGSAEEYIKTWDLNLNSDSSIKIIEDASL